jgi:putative endonuclease
MSESQTLGQKGENEAVLFLKEAGYKIRHRNWRSGKRELDIVAETENYIVFVEVKTRSDNYLLPPSKAVTDQKEKLMIYAAESYIKRYELDKESRFDIISVISKGDTFKIEHTENAFYPTLR